LIDLTIIGALVGVLSGFFGIGGGTILVPILLLLGYDMKTAIGISVMQMVFSSIYGSYLNLKKGTLDVKMVSSIGLGGFLGALSSSVIISNVDAIVLESLFLGFVVFALIRMFFKNKEASDTKEVPKVILFFIGTMLGAFSISIGVGGSILLVPILVGFLHVPIKNAISAGLFFVVFSSLSGFISLSVNGSINYEEGSIIGIASLVGVYLGIILKHKTSDALQKKLLLAFYASVSIYLILRLLNYV